MKKHKLWSWSAAGILIGALMAPPTAHAQTVGGQAAAALRKQQQAQQAAQKEVLAESIIVQQEIASGRAFDPSFRAEVKRRLGDRPLTELQESLAAQEGLGPLSPGASQNDLVYTPVFPCRIIDTRVAGGPLLPLAQRDFDVAGAGFAGQGGVAGDCGIPFGPATAVVINFVAVNPSGPGNLRAWPYGGPVPGASIINYAAVPGLNIANGIVIQICDPAVSTCTFDISVLADVSGTHLVADVLGFFQNFKPDTFRRNTNTFVVIPPITDPPVVMTSVAFTPNFTGNALARARGYCNMDGTAATHRINTAIGTTAADAFGSSDFENMGVLALNAPPASGPALMYSAERVIPVTRGVAQTLSVFGRTEPIIGGAGTVDCSVSLVVEGLY